MAEYRYTAILDAEYRADTAVRQLHSDVESVGSAINELDRKVASPEVEVQTGEAISRLEEVDRRLQGVDGKKARAGVDVEIGEAMRDLERAQAALERIDRKRVSPEIDIELTRTLGDLALLQQRLDQIDRGDYSAGFDRMNRSLGESNRLIGDTNRGVDGLHGRMLDLGAVMSLVSLPFLVTGIAALPPLLSAAAAGTVALANGLVAAAGGAAAFGGAAYAMVGGLMAYTAAAKAAVGGTALVREHFMEGRAEALEMQRAVILNTRAARDYIEAQDRFVLGLTRMQAAIGREVLPGLGEMLDMIGGRLPDAMAAFDDDLNRTTGVLRDFVAELTGPRWSETLHVLEFVFESMERGMLAATNVASGLVSVMQVLGPELSDLQKEIVGVTDAFEGWAGSEEGQRQIGDALEFTLLRFRQVSGAAWDFAAALINIGTAVERSGLTGNMMGGLVRMMEQFRELTREGERWGDAIEKFSRDSGPLLTAVGRALGALGGQFFRVAGDLITFRREGEKLTVLEEIFEAIGDSARPLGNLLIGAFRGIGPQIPDLVRNLSMLAETFAGTTPVLEAMLKAANRVLTWFNNLPTPVRDAAASFIVLNAGLKLITGGGVGSLGGLLGGLTNVTQTVGILGALSGKGSIGSLVARLGALGGLLAAGGLLIGGLGLLYAKNEDVREAVNDLGGAVTRVFGGWASRLKNEWGPAIMGEVSDIARAISEIADPDSVKRLPPQTGPNAAPQGKGAQGLPAGGTGLESSLGAQSTERWEELGKQIGEALGAGLRAFLIGGKGGKGGEGAEIGEDFALAFRKGFFEGLDPEDMFNDWLASKKGNWSWSNLGERFANSDFKKQFLDNIPSFMEVIGEWVAGGSGQRGGQGKAAQGTLKWEDVLTPIPASVFTGLFDKAGSFLKLVGEWVAGGAGQRGGKSGKGTAMNWREVFDRQFFSGLIPAFLAGIPGGLTVAAIVREMMGGQRGGAAAPGRSGGVAWREVFDSSMFRGITSAFLAAVPGGGIINQLVQKLLFGGSGAGGSKGAPAGGTDASSGSMSGKKKGAIGGPFAPLLDAWEDFWDNMDDIGDREQGTLVAGVRSWWSKHFGEQGKGQKSSERSFGSHWSAQGSGEKKGTGGLITGIQTWWKEHFGKQGTGQTNSERSFGGHWTNQKKKQSTEQGNMLTSLGNWLADWLEKIKNWGLVKAFEEKFNAVKGATDTWIKDMGSKLSGFLKELGIGSSPADERNKDMPNQGNPRTPRPGGPVQEQYDGGVYNAAGVRYMNAGGIAVDSAGVYTAITTGMDLALSRGAVWQAATGGISDGMHPRVVYGEGRPGDRPKREGYVPEDMEPGRARSTLGEIARWFDLAVVPARALAGLQNFVGGGARDATPRSGGGGKADTSGSAPGSHAHDSPYHTQERYFFRNPAARYPQHAGGGSVRMAADGGVMFMANGSWYPHVADVNAEVESRWPTQGSTYPGHGADGDPMNSVDWVMPSGWGVYASGSSAQVGNEIVGFLEGAQRAITDYIIWMGRANYGGGWEPYTGGGGYAYPTDVSGRHEDHVHWEALTGGATGTYNPEGGGGGFLGMDVGALVDGFLERLPKPDYSMMGAYGGKLEKAAYSGVVDSLRSILMKLADAAGLASPGGSAAPPASGDLQDWAKSGLTYGAAFEPSTANINAITTLAMKESGGDPRAQNPTSSAAGLMQIIETTWNAYKVAASDDIFNPVHNVAASSRYQQDRYGELVTFSPYTRGGIATRPQVATVAENGPEFFMPLTDPDAARKFVDFLESTYNERLGRTSTADRRGGVTSGGARGGGTSGGAAGTMSQRDIRSEQQGGDETDAATTRAARGATGGDVSRRGAAPRGPDPAEKQVRELSNLNENLVKMVERLIDENNASAARHEELLERMRVEMPARIGGGVDDRLKSNPKTNEALRHREKREALRGRAHGPKIGGW